MNSSTENVEARRFRLLQAQIVLQYVFVYLPVSVVAALHPVNAVIMFWLTISVARRAIQLLQQGEHQQREKRIYNKMR